MNAVIHRFKGEYFYKNHLQIHVSRFTEDFEVPFHSHDFIEFNLVAEGKGFHYISNQVNPVRKGQLFIIPVGTPHVFRPASTDTEHQHLIVYNCSFEPTVLDELKSILVDSSLLRFIEELKDTGFGLDSYDEDGTIEKILSSMHREYSLLRSGSETFISTLLIQLIIAVYRLQTNVKQGTISENLQFEVVIQYVEQHLHEELTLSLLASNSKWSVRHLQRLFVRYTGQTFGKYVQNMRIRKSCEQLHHSQLKISTIAENVGYRHLESFNSAFKKIMGETPSQFRTRIFI
ncbi:helix-turn-helix domain-containing protein [Paenibacillus harenae]|uniref:helix-turn-helix domain-containing protein n=1 Tax=Paenibacillus harenae TaxID=306543 RepID=UPI00279096B2|nr:helix-turn-helix domain-containing protein [Paenibacillus harenae]MDQ0062257.1 AraC family L-rhamnose operon transcriptional activator RhaR [Paenibacillus harenae]